MLPCFRCSRHITLVVMTWMIVLPLTVLMIGLPLAHLAIRPRAAAKPERRQRVVLDHQAGFDHVERGLYQ